jgi:hypothetical protein
MENQNPEIRRLMDAIPLPASEKEILDVASAHNRLCKCEVCLKWWRLMTDESETDFGPFTKAEVYPTTQGPT